MEKQCSSISYKQGSMNSPNVLRLEDHPRLTDSFGNLHELPFTPKFAIKKNEPEIKEILNVSSWADME